MRPIPAALRGRFDELHSEWIDTDQGVVFGMEEVGQYCKITGDPNIIHTVDFPTPVLPGLLELVSLGRYLQSKPPMFIDGYHTLLTHITGDFKQLVRIGTPLSLRYRSTNLESDNLGPRVDCQFCVIRTGSETVVVEGTISLHFVEDRLFKALVRTACK